MKRPKDVLKEYLRSGQVTDDQVTHELFGFVYWLEGQDRPNMACRYHIVPAVESECPFDARETA